MLFVFLAATRQSVNHVSYFPLLTWALHVWPSNLLIRLVLIVHEGQSSLPESCPVCDHNPISPDLCKPNKALRTTLKAFLRTEEKKREKERPSATPVTPTIPITEESVTKQDVPQVAADQVGPEKARAEAEESNLAQPHAHDAQNGGDSHDAVDAQVPTASAEDKVCPRLRVIQ